MRTQTILAFVLFLAVELRLRIRQNSQHRRNANSLTERKLACRTPTSARPIYSQLMEVSSQSEAFVYLPVITPFRLQRTKTTTGRSG